MENDLQALGAKLAESKDILIFIAENPSSDVMASSLGLYLALKSSGKKVSVVCESQALVRDSRLVGLDEVKNTLAGHNLTLTINVEGDVVDKVTSAVNAGKLTLTIVPKDGFGAITKENILFGSSGAQADLTLVMGAGSLSDVGSIAVSEASFFAQTTIANISNVNSYFGKINLVDPTSSLSELVTAVIQELKLPLSEDAAGNLMQGIEAATNNLQSENMTADTFEALAVLYRAGARHHSLPTHPVATIIDNTPVILERATEDQKDIQALEEELHSMAEKPDLAAEVEAATVGSHSSPDPAWLKPKIFKSK